MCKFKVGDEVKCRSSPVDLQEHIGKIVTVSEITGDGKIKNIKEWEMFGWSYCDGWFDLINNKTKNMDLIKMVKNLFATEPQKSLQKTGIFDESGTVTDDGIKVYVTSLILKDTAFQTNTVAKLVAEMEAESKE